MPVSSLEEKNHLVAHPVPSLVVLWSVQQLTPHGRGQCHNTTKSARCSLVLGHGATQAHHGRLRRLRRGSAVVRRARRQRQQVSRVGDACVEERRLAGRKRPRAARVTQLWTGMGRWEGNGRMLCPVCQRSTKCCVGARPLTRAHGALISPPQVSTGHHPHVHSPQSRLSGHPSLNLGCRWPPKSCLTCRSGRRQDRSH